MGVWRWTSDGRAARFTAWYRSPRRKEGDCAYIDLTGQPGWSNTPCNPGYRTGFVCERPGQKLETLFGAALSTAEFGFISRRK